MKKELQTHLFRKYPIIFSSFIYGENDSNPSTIDCGDGWFNLIDALCENINRAVRRKNAQYERFLKREAEENYEEEVTRSWGYERHPDIKIESIFSKAGKIKIYLHQSRYSSEIKGMLALAESMSRYICEDCSEQKSDLNNNHCQKTFKEEKINVEQ